MKSKSTITEYLESEKMYILRDCIGVFIIFLVLTENVSATDTDAHTAVFTALKSLQDYEGSGRYFLDLEVSVHRHSKQAVVPEVSRTQILCFNDRMQVKSEDGVIIVDNKAFVGLLKEHRRIIVRQATPDKVQETKDQSFALGVLRDSLIKTGKVAFDENKGALRHVHLLMSHEMRVRSQIIGIHAWLETTDGSLKRLAIDYSSHAPFQRAEFEVLKLQRGSEVKVIPPEPLATIFDGEGTLLPEYSEFTLIDLRDEVANQ